ncbi:MAG: hypothetical protein LLG02_10795 [Pelosinus sp.]|nr:hypothetical protein [Pelosinus sp.]
MNKVNVLLLRFFLWGLPFVILLAVFSASYNEQLIVSASYYIRLLYNLAGFIFAVWMVLSIYLGICLMFSEKFREKVLAKLTLLKERDEREAMLTGKAAKTTMLTTIAILLFLFCLSCFQVSVYSVPPEQAINGKSNVISLNFKFSVLKDSSPAISSDVIKKSNIFEYNGLPISGSAVIIGLIMWQIIAYNYSMRRFMK